MLAALFPFNIELPYCCATWAKTFGGRPSISSEDAEVRAPDDTLVIDPEPREGIELEPLSVDPEPEGPTGVLADGEDGDPPLPGAAIGEETLLA